MRAGRVINWLLKPPCPWDVRVLGSGWQATFQGPRKPALSSACPWCDLPWKDRHCLTVSPDPPEAGVLVLAQSLQPSPWNGLPHKARTPRLESNVNFYVPETAIFRWSLGHGSYPQTNSMCKNPSPPKSLPFNNWAACQKPSTRGLDQCFPTLLCIRIYWGCRRSPN